MDRTNETRREIFLSTGYITRPGRKTLRKYGKNPSVSSTREDITFNGGTEVFTAGNVIDTISSDSAADTSAVIYIEGTTIDINGDMSFSLQTATLDAVDARTKVTLSTPLHSCTRMRGSTAGDVYAYEDTPISAGVPVDDTKIRNVLVAGENASLKASTSVAKNNFFAVDEVWADLNRESGNAEADIRLRVANLDNEYIPGEFATQFTRAVSRNISLSEVQSTQLIVEPNSHIVIDAESSSTAEINAGFNGRFFDIVNFGAEVSRVSSDWHWVTDNQCATLWLENDDNDGYVLIEKTMFGDPVPLYESETSIPHAYSDTGNYTLPEANPGDMIRVTVINSLAETLSYKLSGCVKT